MSSILTNNSAMVALQNLKSINMDLSKTQNEISTGKSISSASDNASMWAISKVMEADVAGFSAISKSLALGESTVAVAAAGADKIVDILKEIKGCWVVQKLIAIDFYRLQTLCCIPRMNRHCSILLGFPTHQDQTESRGQIPFCISSKRPRSGK